MWSRIRARDVPDMRDPTLERRQDGTHAAASDALVDVLMYHSISHKPGPTSIPPEIFRAHLEILKTCGCEVVSLSAFANWLAGLAGLPPRCAVMTFDDGFADFAEHALPPLEARNWTATVFLPTGKLGGVEDWEGAHPTPRRLLDWEQVRDLARRGIEFGAHSVSHADLARLSVPQLECEVRKSGDDIAQQIGKHPISFAPPYGRSSPRVRAEVRKWYRVAVGTRLQRASRQCDPYDVPRIEMHYFRDVARWRSHVERRDTWYFGARRALRRIRQLAAHGWQR